MNKEFQEVLLTVEKEIAVAAQEVRANEFEFFASRYRNRVSGMLRVYKCIPGWRAEFVAETVEVLRADKKRKFTL